MCGWSGQRSPAHHQPQGGSAVAVTVAKAEQSRAAAKEPCLFFEGSTSYGCNHKGEKKEDGEEGRERRGGKKG